MSAAPSREVTRLNQRIVADYAVYPGLTVEEHAIVRVAGPLDPLPA